MKQRHLVSSHWQCHWMADGNSHLSGMVRSIGRRRETNAFCFIKNTDCPAPDSRNAFIFLPDAFAHRTIFSSEDWSQLTINRAVGYHADVVKRSRTGCMKLHVTSAWVKEEYEQEEEQSSGVFANDEAPRPPWRQHPFIIPAEEGMEQEKKKEQQDEEEAEEEAEEEERGKEEEEEEEEEEPVMVSRRRRFIIPFEEETKDQWNSKKRFRLAQAPIGIRRISVVHGGPHVNV
jgi:hypothetical protein